MADLKLALEVEEMRKLGVAEMRRAYEKLANDYNRILNNDLCYCGKCNTFKSARSFYNDKSYKSGLFPICRDCIVIMVTDGDKKSDDRIDNKDKMMDMLRMMNLPYISSVYKSTVDAVKTNEGERNRNLVWSEYIRMVKSLPQYTKSTWNDSVFDQDDTVVEVVNTRVAKPETKKIFGQGYTESDYVFLEDNYNDFKARTQVDSISQELYVKQICQSLLEIDKDRKNGKDVTNKLKSLDTLMNSANLQPKQSVDNTADDTLSLGQWIEKIENTQPISEPDEEFKDVNGIGKYIRVWFTGWLSKVVGIKNTNTKEFEEEISKYTVEKPEVVDDIEIDEVYTALFGKQE